MLEEVAARSAMPRGLITTRAFPLLLPPLSSYGRLLLSWRNEIARLKSYSLEPNVAVIRKEPTARKTALEITGSTTLESKFGVGPLYLVRDQCLPAGAKFDADTPHTR
jgi:hypothetical protein